MDSSRLSGLILNKIKFKMAEATKEWSDEIEQEEIEQNCESEDELVEDYSEDDEVLELSGT